MYSCLCVCLCICKLAELHAQIFFIISDDHQPRLHIYIHTFMFVNPHSKKFVNTLPLRGSKMYGLAPHFLYAKVDYAQFITINRELRKAATENNCKANFEISQES